MPSVTRSLGVHLDDVADLAYVTALRLGAREDDVDVVRLTALLHEVGKVAIPEEILCNPGSLGPSDWAFVKQHTVIGERIIAAAPALATVARYVRSRHERFDGGGYPDGLAGAEIPLAARIVLVCDAFDAMTDDRSYSAAMDRPAAVMELRL